MAETIDRKTSESPMVTMMMEMIGSPIMGRRISRSMNSARTIPNRMVSRRAAQNGTCIWTRKPKQTYAPTIRSSPWAKLTTRVAL